MVGRLPKEDRDFGQRFIEYIEPELRAIAGGTVPKPGTARGAVIEKSQPRLSRSREPEAGESKKRPRRRTLPRDHPQRGKRIVVRVFEDETGKRHIHVDEL